MASENGSDPPDRLERRRSSLQLETEDLVAQQTEEVFQSYAFHRYQQELEQNEADVPIDPEIAAIQQEPGSTFSLVGRRLATIADDINERYDKEFREMLNSLQLTRENAYEYFTKIASRMAIHVYQHGMTGFLRRIAHFIADFVLHNHIARWIAQQGGWVAAMDLSNVYLKYMIALAALILLGQFVIRRFFRP